MTKSGAVVGTPAYMSPEQARGLKVDHRTDLFSLGAVLYRLCTGRNPFAGEHVMAVLAAVLTDEPTPVRELNPSVPEPLAELIHQLLSKSADARPASAEEVVKRLRAIRGQGAAAPVVYVPIQVTALPGASAFADLEVTATSVAAAPTADAETANMPTPAAVRRKPSRPWGPLAAGVASLALVLVLLAGVIIVIRNRDGSETKIEVPEGATVTLKGKDGKTIAQAGPGAKTPAVSDDPDRKAAEYIVSLGRSGRIEVNGQEREFSTAADLPKERFTLRLAPLFNVAATDEGLTNFKNCKGLTWLSLDGSTKVTDAGLANFKGCKGLERLQLHSTAVTDAGLANFKDCKGLTTLDVRGTKVTAAGLAEFHAAVPGCRIAHDGGVIEPKN
ncbi:MAG: protein kinase domain-containing protein [Gemmata sp.]